MKNHFGCPVQATSNVIAGKWKVLIVWHLSFGSRRFAEIRDLLPGVSEKVLTAQLRELEHDGVIRRLVTETVPPRGLHVERCGQRTHPSHGSDVRLGHKASRSSTKHSPNSSESGLDSQARLSDAARDPSGTRVHDPGAHSFPLFGQEDKRAYVQATKFIISPTGTHEATHRVRVQAQQQMAQLVRHNAAEDSVDTLVRGGAKLTRAVPKHVGIAAPPVRSKKGYAEGVAGNGGNMRSDPEDEVVGSVALCAGWIAVRRIRAGTVDPENIHSGNGEDLLSPLLGAV